MPILILLAFLIMPYAAYSQDNGEAQTVIVENDKRLTLKFTNKTDNKRCGFFVSNRVVNQEQAFAVRVAHLHYSFHLGWGLSAPQLGGSTLPEQGWLYITPSRITFTVEEGDKSHSFDLPRSALKSKPGERKRHTFSF